MLNKKTFLAAVLFFLVVLTSIFYFRYQVYYSHGNEKNTKMFVIEKGDGNAIVAGKLKDAGMISGKIYFYYYVRTHGMINKIMPGNYQLSGNMTIPEIAREITNPEEAFVKVTFPEGWDSKNMAARLIENGLDGEGFLKIVNDPQDFKKRYTYLQNDKVKTLEGFLFPDTYYFKKDISAENIVGRMLDTFDSKLTDKMRQDIADQGYKVYDMVIMASIIEEEVQTTADREVVGGIFWNRIGVDMPLQSDATLTYALGDKKGSHSVEETHMDSPYNTYVNKGLPPTPIDNPSLDSLNSAIYPQKSDYMYFVSDPETGKTYFAKTYDEHNVNKVKVGL